MASATARRGWRKLRLFESRMARDEALWAYVFLLANVSLFAAFTIYPVFASFYYSLTKWTNLAEKGTFIGIDNYINLAGDEIFRTVLVNTFYYTFGVIPLQTVLGLAIAVLLNQNVRLRTVYRAAYFVPVVTSMVAVSMVWQWMYQAQYGIINSFLKALGIEGPNWLFSKTWSMPAVIVMSIWKNVGYSIVLYLAALQGVPEQLYESAHIDGANAWQRFRHITIPLISATTFFIIVLSIIGSFQSFDQIYVLTQGGPGRTTSVIVHYLYQNGFQWFNMGYAAAIAWVLFAILFAFTLLQWSQRTRWVFGEE